MTQLELARRALKTAQTHLRLASALMTLDAETRDNVRALHDDVTMALADLATVGWNAEMHLAVVRKRRGGK